MLFERFFITIELVQDCFSRPIKTSRIKTWTSHWTHMLHMSVSWKLIQHLQATSQLCCLICNLKPEDNKLQMHRRVAKLGHRVKVGVVYWSKPNYEVWVQRTSNSSNATELQQAVNTVVLNGTEIWISCFWLAFLTMLSQVIQIEATFISFCQILNSSLHNRHSA